MNQDVVIIGAGAAGLMCAIESAKRGRSTMVIDHANRAGKKILMSGGGRCNFTNYHIEPSRYLSHNPHFCKSALSRYSQWDFIELVKSYAIAFHEKTLGQLFCDGKANAIVQMLLAECEKYHVDIRLNTSIETIEAPADHAFQLMTSVGLVNCESLVVASGGLSIPTMGASPLGYKVAQQFGLKVWPTRAGLVPLTLQPEDKERLAVLSGIGLDSEVRNHRQAFREHTLFTHRGLSGPAILQMSSYWWPGEALCLNLLPTQELSGYLKQQQKHTPLKQVDTVLAEFFPKRVLDVFLPTDVRHKKMADCAHAELADVAQRLQAWSIKPNGTEGYRTAEVTLGGVDCDALSSKTMESKSVPGLYFIGEVVDVTGWLGGYNFQWAWSSGWAAGQVV